VENLSKAKSKRRDIKGI